MKTFLILLLLLAGCQVFQCSLWTNCVCIEVPKVEAEEIVVYQEEGEQETIIIVVDTETGEQKTLIIPKD